MIEHFVNNCRYIVRKTKNWH